MTIFVVSVTVFRLWMFKPEAFVGYGEHKLIIMHDTE